MAAGAVPRGDCIDIGSPGVAGKGSAALTLTLVSLTSTLCVAALPSKVAVSVAVPALSERSRDEVVDSTSVSLELNELCEVTVYCEASESCATRLAVAC